MVHVHIHVVPDQLDAFIAATKANAEASLGEPGIRRFDLVQQADDPTRFVLIEAYIEPDAQLRHRETAHYALWRDTVAPMMASPRSAVKFESVYPEAERWATPA